MVISTGYFQIRISFIILSLFSLFMFSCKDKSSTDPSPEESINGNIAFSSDRDGEPRICLMDETGQNLKKVTDDVIIHTQGEQYVFPSFSRDGKKIAFIVYPTGSAQFGIGKVNSDGSDKRLVGSGVPDLQMVNEISAPTWTSYEDVFFVAGHPDGLYYYSGNTGINRIDAEWCFSMYGCSMYVSPSACLMDDSGVIFGTDSKIILVKFDGQVSTLFDGIGHNECPGFSPDKSKIVTGNGQDIFVMNANGSNLLQLTSNNGLNKYPVWSPDGKKIAFSSTRDGNFEIYVMNSDGSNQTNLTQNSGIDFGPTWARR